MSMISESTFFKKPKVIYVDEDYSVKPPPYGTISKLVQSLKDNGPLVARGKMGPDAYKEPAFKLTQKVHNQEVYGWKPLTFKESSPARDVILLHAEETKSKSYVYYSLAQDITKDQHSLIRGYKPLDSDSKVYVMSYNNFLERSLVDLHPICPEGQWLFSVPVNAILDGSEVEKKCKEIGQRIFDQYKANARGNSEVARDAVIRICDAAKFLTSDGPIRKAHIECAWDGIGDHRWQWQS